MPVNKQDKERTQQRKKPQSGSSKLVISKIEHTKTASLLQYRKGNKEMTVKIVKYAIPLSPNLLSVKIALMESVREVERMMQERKG